MDDVLNVSGHRLGTAEIESALVSHKAVAEAAVVGYPHDIKGEGIYAYITLVLGEEPRDELLAELRLWVRKANRADCNPGPDAMGARPAQDPFRQDHAADPAQNRGQ